MAYWKVAEKLGKFFMPTPAMSEQQLRMAAHHGGALEDMCSSEGWKIMSAKISAKTQTAIHQISNNPAPDAVQKLVGKISAYRELEEEIANEIIRGRKAVAELEKIKQKEQPYASAKR